MTKRRNVAVASLLTGVIPFLGIASAANATPGPRPSPVVGHTYTDDNNAGPNTVSAFDRHADGSLTPTAGSPFAIGGTGLGKGLGSQGALQSSPFGRYLLAADPGSNQISVLRVTADGVPVPVGAPVSSGGVEPVSIAVSPFGLVYVANVGVGGSNYTGFRMTFSGQLIPIPNSTVAVPEGSGVGDVLFNSFGDRLVGTRDNTSLIDSFTVGFDGRLTAAAGSPYAAQSLGPIGAEFRPTNPDQLFVSNAHAGAGNGTVSAFHDSFRGVLTSIGDSPYPDLQTAPCWVEISHDGKYLFAVNTASGTVSSYSINRDGSLVLLSTATFTNGVNALDARLSPDGRFLSVIGGSSHELSTFSVDGGTLTELPSSPVALPADSSAAGLVVLDR